MFKINELTEVTGGRLISGKKDVFISRISIDSRTIKEGDLFIAIKGDRFDGHDFIEEAIKKKAKAAIVDSSKVNIKSVNLSIVKVKDTVRALADIATYHRKKFNIPVIAVTGSNGKTTTKEMLAWILEEKLKVLKNPGTQNNQIGLPMALLNLNKHFDVVVLEMGTNHLGEIEYLARIAQPNIGIINNIGPAHLQFFHTQEGAYREKCSLIDNLISPSIAILNMDDRFLRRNKNDKDKFVIGFAINNNADYKASKIKLEENKIIRFLVNSRYSIHLKTLGLSNVYNALVAISVSRLLGLDYNIIAKRLYDFNFPKSRLTFMNTENINFIDDTYNSNPASLKQALDTLNNLKISGRRIFVMGDMLELGSHKENLHRLAGKRIARVCDVLVTVGSLTKLTAREALKSGLDSESIFNCDCSEEAKTVLLDKINPNKNDIVLIKGSRLMRMEEVLK